MLTPRRRRPRPFAYVDDRSTQQEMDHDMEVIAAMRAHMTAIDPNIPTSNMAKPNGGKTDMQLAMEEYRATPEYQAEYARREAERLEYERLSEVDLFLRPIQRGQVRNSRDNSTFYAVLLFEKDENGDGIRNILPMPEPFMGRFADNEQAFRVEGGDIGPDDVFEAVEWADTQTSSLCWSIMQRVNRRHPATSPVYVFSFSDEVSATLFKMRWG